MKTLTEQVCAMLTDEEIRAAREQAAGVSFVSGVEAARGRVLAIARAADERLAEQQVEVERLREGLSFYAAERRYRPRAVDGEVVAMRDGGAIARRVLDGGRAYPVAALAEAPTPKGASDELDM